MSDLTSIGVNLNMNIIKIKMIKWGMKQGHLTFFQLFMLKIQIFCRINHLNRLFLKLLEKLLLSNIMNNFEQKGESLYIFIKL